MLTTILGVACAVAGTLLAIPQLLRVAREKTSAGVSLAAWQVWTGVGLAWALHGALDRNLVVIIPNTAGMLIAAATIHLVGRDRHLGALRVWLPALGWAVFGVAVRLLLGPLAFGLAMILPQYVAVVGQLVDVITKRDLSGLSPVYLTINVATQVLWLAYGLAKPDSALTASAIAMLAIAVATFGWYLARRGGLRPLGSRA